MSRNLQSNTAKLARDVVSEYFSTSNKSKKQKQSASGSESKFKRLKIKKSKNVHDNQNHAEGCCSSNQVLTVEGSSKSEREEKRTTPQKRPIATEKGSLKDIEDLKQPANWEEVLMRIREMRSGQDAPVDSMGCDQCADSSAPLSTQRLHHLLSLMLSSQTKDQVTFAAMARLRGIPGGLNIETILQLPEDELGRLIIPVGFWKTKAKHIKAACQLLKDQHGGDIPNTVEGLCKLPGVGPKMAHLCMQSAWGVVSGIGVDTHVHRISNRLGWVRKTKTPEKTRTELEAWLPHSLWREVNHLLVGLGQTVCKPIKPNCAECLANKLCPSAGKG